MRAIIYVWSGKTTRRGKTPGKEGTMADMTNKQLALILKLIARIQRTSISEEEKGEIAALLEELARSLEE